MEINFFFSRSRFLKSRFFSRDFDASRFLSRLLRRVEIVEICQDASRFSRFVETQLRFVEKSRHCRGLKSRRIEKSQRENTKIHALLGRDRDKLSRNFRSRWISRSRSRLFGLDIVVETKSRSLNLDRDISIVETNFLTLSRFSWLSRLTLWRRRDRESWSRPFRDKSRPPCLIFAYFLLRFLKMLSLFIILRLKKSGLSWCFSSNHDNLNSSLQSGLVSTIQTSDRPKPEFKPKLGIIASKQISVFGSILNLNFGRNQRIEWYRNRNRNAYRNRYRNRKFPITNPDHLNKNLEISQNVFLNCYFIYCRCSGRTPIAHSEK